MIVLPLTVAFTTSISLIAMWWADHVMQTWVTLGGYFSLQLSHNAGIAFGFGIPSPWQERLIALAIVLVTAFAYVDRDSTNKLFGYGLILGGAFANLADRAIDGVVTDMIRVGGFPVFNLADAAISIGVGVLLLEIFFDE